MSDITRANPAYIAVDRDDTIIPGKKSKTVRV
jgi:hypothetical protein